jgi:hypothetical protein
MTVQSPPNQNFVQFMTVSSLDTKSRVGLRHGHSSLQSDSHMRKSYMLLMVPSIRIHIHEGNK